MSRSKMGASSGQGSRRMERHEPDDLPEHAPRPLCASPAKDISEKGNKRHRPNPPPPQDPRTASGVTSPKPQDQMKRPSDSWPGDLQRPRRDGYSRIPNPRTHTFVAVDARACHPAGPAGTTGSRRLAVAGPGVPGAATQGSSGGANVPAPAHVPKVRTYHSRSYRQGTGWYLPNLQPKIRLRCTH